MAKLAPRTPVQEYPQSSSDQQVLGASDILQGELEQQHSDPTPWVNICRLGQTYKQRVPCTALCWLKLNRRSQLCFPEYPWNATWQRHDAAGGTFAVQYKLQEICRIKLVMRRKPRMLMQLITDFQQPQPCSGEVQILSWDVETKAHTMHLQSDYVNTMRQKQEIETTVIRMNIIWPVDSWKEQSSKNQISSMDKSDAKRKVEWKPLLTDMYLCINIHNIFLFIRMTSEVSLSSDNSHFSSGSLNHSKTTHSSNLHQTMPNRHHQINSEQIIWQ